jgi:hypothetical protein
LSQKVDFLSIGTNGLFQFIFTADRVNDRVTGRYGTLALAFFWMLDQITRACGNGGTRRRVRRDGGPPFESARPYCIGAQPTFNDGGLNQSNIRNDDIYDIFMLLPTSSTTY